MTRLVRYEAYELIDAAIAREKLKNWRRDWKIRPVEEMNPEWEDPYLTLNR